MSLELPVVFYEHPLLKPVYSLLTVLSIAISLQDEAAEE